MVARSMTSPADPPERIHALDAVRAGALLLGVAFHAAGAYLPTREAPVQDAASPALLVFTLVSHNFRMTLFFLVAGFFARMMIERRGEGGFVRNRASRVALPLVVFSVPMAFLISLIGLWSASVDPGAVWPGWPPLGLRTVPLTHLWFLYYLCLFYVAALALRTAARLVDRRGRAAATADKILLRLVSWQMAAALAALPFGLLLGWRDFMSVVEGLQTPSGGVVPHLMPLAAYGTAFALGWFLQRQRTLLGLLQRQGPLHLLAAAALSAPLFLPTPASAPLNLIHHVPGSGLYALASWCWTLGFLGVALRFFSAERPGVRYMADASYWIYLVHVPVVISLQTLIFPLNWPPLAKWAVVLGATLALATASYQLLVRHTCIGAWLNGFRLPRAGEVRPRRLGLAPRMQDQSSPQLPKPSRRTAAAAMRLERSREGSGLQGPADPAHAGRLHRGSPASRKRR